MVLDTLNIIELNLNCIEIQYIIALHAEAGSVQCLYVNC